MTDPANQDSVSSLSVFGLPPAMARQAATTLQDGLERLWEACHQRPIGGLRSDLESHHRYFNPVAQGKRLRTALLDIDPVSLPASVSRVQAIAVDEERSLITPEGRVALELVMRALEKKGEDIELSETLARQRERDLLALYRDWNRHRLASIIDLLGGGKKPLQNPAIGGVLTLLVNRSDVPERAITRFPPGTARDVIDDVFRSCANAFAQEIAPSSRRSETKERLISGWTLGEVKRRMPDALYSSDEDGVYVVKDRAKDLVSLLVAELQKRGYDRGRVEDSFDALVREFKRRSQELAGYGLLFERPTDTARLRKSLFDAWPTSD